MNKKIVCLGGGIGTVNLIKGLKEHTDNITVVVSMADDGASAGRLRRLYGVPPPGDLVNCIAAMSQVNKDMKDLLTFRFSGNRWGSDGSLGGQKLGNLILVALTNITGNFSQATSDLQKIFNVSGKILPSTDENISIWAETSVGEKVYREENIDLGRFTGKIEKLHIRPANPMAPKEVIEAILNADAIIAGPGDLFTTIMPTILVPGILKAIRHSKAKKFFVVNVTNKVFETPDFKIDDYADAILKHCKSIVFNSFFINNNLSPKIPKKYKRQYEYVPPNGFNNLKYSVVSEDLIDEAFPLYHDSKKLAKAIAKSI
ncbi:MAG: YvcK family protein [Patescibacteria group bacterium]|nr:YvcK family protein [Patescibacteria group bacterium]